MARLVDAATALLAERRPSGDQARSVAEAPHKFRPWRYVPPRRTSRATAGGGRQGVSGSRPRVSSPPRPATTRSAPACSRWRWPPAGSREGQLAPLRLDVRAVGNAWQLIAGTMLVPAAERTIEVFQTVCAPGPAPSVAGRAVVASVAMGIPEEHSTAALGRRPRIRHAELGGRPVQFPDPVGQVLQPMMTNIFVDWAVTRSPPTCLSRRGDR